MVKSLIRGSTQIMEQSVTLSLLDPALTLPDSYLANGSNFIKRNGSVAFTGNVNLGGNRITGLGAGVSGTDAATVAQLQAYLNGFHLHFVRAVAVANVPLLGGLPTIDGVTLAVGNIVFLTGQNTQPQNGPWRVAVGAWTRPSDWASGSTQTEGHYFIAEPDGTDLKNTKWFLANVDDVIVDTSNVSFIQDAGSNFTIGNGLALANNTLSVARGNGVGLDGNNAVTVASDPARLLQTTIDGIGIKDGVAAQILMANSAGRASYQNLSGDVSLTATGAVTVNHTPANGFLKYTDVVVNDFPSGIPNGSLTKFTLTAVPQVSSLQLFKNGILLRPGAGNDYTISGAEITMLAAPLTGDQLQATYVK